MKKKLLVFTSTFPRWKNDTLPPFVYELSRRLTDKFNVIVLAPAFPGSKDYEVMDKMKVHRFHYFFRSFEKLAGNGGILPALKKNPLYYFVVPFFLLAEYFALKKLVKEINPDIIQAHWIIPQGLIAYLVNKSCNIPYIVTSHGSDIMCIKGLSFIKGIVLCKAKKIIVVSNALKAEIQRKTSSNLIIEVIPMGIDTNLFHPSHNDLRIRKKYKIESDFLLFVGRLAPEKGIDMLIEAMPKLIEKRSKIKLMIIGNGTLKGRMVQRCKELKISDSVIFLEWIDNKKLPEYYAAADYFICPSKREGSPVSYIEALSCGTRIIVGDLPISREIIGGKNVGFIINCENNKKDMSDQIISFILRKVKNNKIETHNRIKKIYDWKIIAKKYVEVLN